MQLQKTLANTHLDRTPRDLLIESIRSAGYLPGEGPSPASAFYPDEFGADETSLGSKTATVWSLLDTGVARSLLRSRAPQSEVTAHLRHRVIQNILQEVRSAYYREASAEQLLPEVNAWLRQSHAAIQEINEPSAAQSPQKNELKRRLIETNRKLWRLAEQLGAARADFASMMNLAPGIPYTVVVPDWQASDFPPLATETALLENITLRNRKELKISPGHTPSDAPPIRRALLNLQPGLPFDLFTGQTSKGTSYDQSWCNMGFQIAGTFFDDSARNHSERSAALNMAVITQLHLAFQRYMIASENFRLTGMLDAMSEPPPPPADPFAKTGRSDDPVVAFHTAFNSLTVKHKRHMAFAELENAANRIYTTIGVDSLPVAVESQTMPLLSVSFEKAIAEWPSSLKKARIAPSSDIRPLAAAPNENSRTEGQAPSGQPPANEKQKPSLFDPKPQKPDTATLASSPPVVGVDAHSAEKQGRKVTKEVAIYRDAVNIHQAADPTSPIKGQGLIGETYPLIGWAPNGWLKIEMGDGSTGWVPTKFVKPMETKTVPAPQVEPPPRTVPAEAKAPEKPAVIITISRANVRTLPDLTAPIQFVSEKGIRYPVDGILNGWFKIRTPDGANGWLHTTVVTVPPTEK